MQIWFHATKCKFVAKNSSLKCWLCSHDFKNQKSQYMFFRAPNNIFAYTIVHPIFVASQKVVCARVYAHVYLIMHLVQRQKYFRVEGKLMVYSTHHQHRIWSGYPDCFLYEKKQQTGSPVCPEPNNQTTFCQLCLKARNMLVLPSVCWFKTASLLAKF